LYNFLERLPAWGQYKAQMAMDEEWAERILGVRSAVFAAQSERGEQPIPALPRPTTAMDVVRERRVIAELLLIEQEIFGGGLGIQKE
jgi:hypothetical protein